MFTLYFKLLGWNDAVHKVLFGLKLYTVDSQQLFVFILQHFISLKSDQGYAIVYLHAVSPGHNSTNMSSYLEQQKRCDILPYDLYDCYKTFFCIQSIFLSAIYG